jgi:phage-related tail fiber protein
MGPKLAALAVSGANVGIGTANPRATLHVHGDIQCPALVSQVAYFASSSAPTGWLKCNGAAVSRTTYAALFVAIGTTFGGGNGSTTFTLPDLRGEFIRGWDDARTVDNGRTFGSFQVDAFQGHRHSVNSSSDFWRNAPGFSYFPPGSSWWANPYGSITVNEPTDYGYGAPRYTNETRPRNLALLACIKY